MMYVTYDSKIGWDYRRYFSYIESVRDSMSDALYKFASSIENYDLTNKNSLHDSWLEEVSIVEDSGIQRGRSVRITANYLGAFHDRRIIIRYAGVEEYEIMMTRERRGSRVAHRDVLVHEVRVADAGVFQHEILFSSGSTFVVAFRDFEHRIESV